MKIVVLGGSGFIGSNIAIYLKKNLKNTIIISIDNFSGKGSRINNKRLKKFNIKNFKKDISTKDSLDDLKKVDLFIDCSADPAVENSKKNLTKVIKNNFNNILNILNSCLKNKASIIFLSTSRVYSIKELNKLVDRKQYKNKFNIKKTIDENFNTLGIKSIYGLSKIFSENLIKEYEYLFKIKYIINRCGTISGPWQFGKQEQGLFSYWMRNHVFGSPIKYIGYGGYGNQVRDVLHIDDLCELILIQIKELNKINNVTVNVGGGKNSKISLRDLTKLCEKITKNTCKVSTITKTSNYDIPFYVSNINKVKKLYKWSPTKSVKQVMTDLFSWIKENKNILNKF